MRPGAPGRRRPAPRIARDLSYRYSDGPTALQALSGVTHVAWHSGDFLAIAGANGAGKSTLAALLTGVWSPPRHGLPGRARRGTEMAAPAVSDRVGYVFQNPEHQFVSDTVFGELAFSLSPKAGRARARAI